jgi:hypothetical protein
MAFSVKWPERKLFEVRYTVQRPDNRKTEGSVVVSARSAMEAAHGLMDTFPGGWWSVVKDCADTLEIDAVAPTRAHQADWEVE